MSRQFFFGPVVFQNYNIKWKSHFTVGAASHKVYGMAMSLRNLSQSTYVVSAPIVTASKNKWLYSGYVGCHKKIPCIYLPAISLRGLNRFFACFTYLLFALRNIKRSDVVIFYNFFPEYVPVAIFLRVFLGHSRVFIDIEDGLRDDDKNLRGYLNIFSFRVLRKLCSDRVVVVSQKLATLLRVEDSLVINGIAPVEVGVNTRPSFSQSPLRVMYGGSIQVGTGLNVFADAVRILANDYPQYAMRFRFIVTGFGGGDELAVLESDARKKGYAVDIRQDISTDQYFSLLKNCHIGLSLKMPSSEYGNTTFPSKVIELTSLGLLLLTTNISDISLIFSKKTAAILDPATPENLANLLIDIAQNPLAYELVAKQGQLMIHNKFSMQSIGKKLLNFLYKT